jgi:trans-aconitate methyltransferase
VSLELFDKLAIPTKAAVLDIGGGASTLVDGLIARGFKDLTVLDVSSEALDTVRLRLGEGGPVVLIQGDLLEWRPERRFDVWHDRAVFHFLVDEEDRRSYFRILRSSLVSGGEVILATFAPDGPEYCSGLPVARYGPDQLIESLGPDVQVLNADREEHVTPAGVIQPFTWVAVRIP